MFRRQLKLIALKQAEESGLVSRKDIKIEESIFMAQNLMVVTIVSTDDRRFLIITLQKHFKHLLKIPLSKALIRK